MTFNGPRKIIGHNNCLHYNQNYELKTYNFNTYRKKIKIKIFFKTNIV